jgi:PPOX class probable F420-dependent enzyme
MTSPSRDHVPGPVPVPAPVPPDLARARYVSLRTFRRDGTPVDCPVWFAASDDGSTIWFRSKADTAKVRRLSARPDVELRPCSWRGVVGPGAAVVRGTAHVLPDDDPAAIEGEQRLSRRYGWQWYTTPLFRIPFTHTTKVDLPLRRKLQLARDRQRLPGSCLVAVTVTTS